jgi:hypothetical protein
MPLKATNQTADYASQTPPCAILKSVWKPASSVHYAIPCPPIHPSCPSYSLPHQTPSTHRTITPPLHTPNITFPPARDGTHITHAILIALVAILLARIRSLPSIIPRRDARKETRHTKSTSFLQFIDLVVFTGRPARRTRRRGARSRPRRGGTGRWR